MIQVLLSVKVTLAMMEFKIIEYFNHLSNVLKCPKL